MHIPFRKTSKNDCLKEVEADVRLGQKPPLLEVTPACLWTDKPSNAACLWTLLYITKHLLGQQQVKCTLQLSRLISAALIAWGNCPLDKCTFPCITTHKCKCFATFLYGIVFAIAAQWAQTQVSGFYAFPCNKCAFCTTYCTLHYICRCMDVGCSGKYIYLHYSAVTKYCLQYNTKQLYDVQ